MDFLKQWAVGLVAFVVADFVWIGLIANGFYRREIGPLLRMQGEKLDPRLAPAFLLYALVVAGLILFALPTFNIKLGIDLGLSAVSDTGAIDGLVEQVIARHADVVAQVRAGDDKPLNFLMGPVMKASQGKAEPG